MALLATPRNRVRPSVVRTGPPPRRRSRPRRVALGVLLVGLVASGIGLAAPTPQPASARAVARHFLDAYVDADGRVVRHGQGGDTHSQGQADALLLAVALDDRATFARVWGWTAAHLQRPGGLLARRWADGRVRDAEPAPAADVAAAHALLLAADRFDEPRHLADGLRIAEALRRVLPAEPGILDPAAFAAFEAAGGLRWWAAQTGSGSTPLAEHAVMKLAAACDPESRAAAAARWPALDALAAQDADAPALVAAAAAAGAAGRPQRGAELLARAEAADAAHPSAGGAAQVALGRVLLGEACGGQRTASATAGARASAQKP